MMLTAIYADIVSYPHWNEVLVALGLDPASTTFDDVTGQAVCATDRGGEGPAHQRLKEYVRFHPAIAGLPPGHSPGTLEFGLASGDRVDVLFESERHLTAVEVKSIISGAGDIERGIFQCVKYLAVLEAQSNLSNRPRRISAMLVIEGRMAPRERAVALALGVTVIEGVRPDDN